MFGYTCIDSVDAMVGFSSISDKIEIVKDEWGYLIYHLGSLMQWVVYTFQKDTKLK